MLDMSYINELWNLWPIVSLRQSLVLFLTSHTFHCCPKQQIAQYVVLFLILFSEEFLMTCLPNPFNSFLNQFNCYIWPFLYKLFIWWFYYIYFLLLKLWFATAWSLISYLQLKLWFLPFSFSSYRRFHPGSPISKTPARRCKCINAHVVTVPCSGLAFLSRVNYFSTLFNQAGSKHGEIEFSPVHLSF